MKIQRLSERIHQATLDKPWVVYQCGSGEQGEWIIDPWHLLTRLIQVKYSRSVSIDIQATQTAFWINCSVKLWQRIMEERNDLKQLNIQVRIQLPSRQDLLAANKRLALEIQKMNDALVSFLIDN